MNCLYLSALSSKRIIQKIYDKTGRNPGFAVQKFSRMFVSGLIKNGISVSALSSIPYTKSDNVFFSIEKSEMEESVHFHYVPYINFNGIKHLIVLFYTILFLFFWSFSKDKEKFIVCDALNITLNLSALIVCRLRHIKIIGVLTDVPGLMLDSKDESKLTVAKKIVSKINRAYLGEFTHYVFLTKQMNVLVNKKNRPYIVMEGMVDERYVKNIKEKECAIKTIVYAGGLFERYGVKKLVEAFRKLNLPNIALHLYGSGPFVSELKQICEEDSRIVYKGIVSNEDILEAEVEATLLVNPRPTDEEFTMYSFPSKNMEYMLSGTPVLTTSLPGMPSEYKSYVYIFDDESVDGFSKKLSFVLSLSEVELKKKGLSAKQFVLKKKNNAVQTLKIIQLIMNS